MKNNYLFRDRRFAIQQVIVAWATVFGGTVLFVILSLLLSLTSADRSVVIGLAFLLVAPAIVGVHIAVYRRNAVLSHAHLPVVIDAEDALERVISLRRKIKDQLQKTTKLKRSLLDNQTKMVGARNRAQSLGRPDIVQEIDDVMNETLELLPGIQQLIDEEHSGLRELRDIERELHAKTADVRESFLRLYEANQQLTGNLENQRSDWQKVMEKFRFAESRL